MGQLFSRRPTSTKHGKSGTHSTSVSTRNYIKLGSSIARGSGQHQSSRTGKSSRSYFGVQSNERRQGTSAKGSKKNPRVQDGKKAASRSNTLGQKKHHVRPSRNSTQDYHPSHLTETKECLICTGTRSLHHFPLRSPTSHCNHPPDVCRRCLRTWLSTEFATKLWSDLSCPICASNLSYADIRAFAPKDIYRRYKILALNHALEAIPNFHWCPSPKCKAGQIQACGTPRFKCAACKRVSCVVHGVPWHKGETCAQYEYRTDGRLKRAEEEASRELMGRTTKKCPGCGRRVEKMYGCDHMTCSKCKHEYCWQCLASYKTLKRGRVNHRPGCDHHIQLGTRNEGTEAVIV